MSLKAAEGEGMKTENGSFFLLNIAQKRKTEAKLNEKFIKPRDDKAENVLGDVPN